MILEVLEAQEQAVFRQELFNTLTTYYEDSEVQSMSGAGGRPKPKHFIRRMIAAEGAAGGGETATEADDEQPLLLPPPAAADEAPANPATPPGPAKKAGKGRGDSVGGEA
jgi:hypothetical protein